jgi:hypothetical protein
MNQDEAEIYKAPVKNYKVYIAIAPRGEPFDESMDSLLNMIRFTQNAGIVVALEKIRRGAPGWHNCGPAISHFLKTDCTHAFAAADDMLYPPDTIIRLLNDDKDIISGIYRKAYVTRTEPANSCRSAEEWQQRYDSKGVYETDFCPGHTMLVKREVYEKMVIDYPELAYVNNDDPTESFYGFFLPIIEDRRAYESDWAFSMRAKQSGFKIWTDYGCRCKHYCYEFLGFEAEV